MKKYLLIGTLFLTLSLFGQERPEFGPVMIIERGYLPNLVGENEKEFFGVSYEKETIIVETFSKKKLRSLSKHEVEIEELRGVTEELEKLAYLNGEIVYFTSLYNYRDDKFDLIAQKIDPRSGRITEKVTLFEKAIDKRYDRGAYNVFVSKNKKRILVRTYTYYKETDQTLENLLLFNDKLELLTEREYSEKGKELNLTSSLLVDDEGSIYFLQNGSIVILDAFNNFEEWREQLPTDNLEVGSSYNRIGLALNEDLDPVITAYYVTKNLEDLDRKKVNKSRDDRKEGDTQVKGIVYFRVNSLDKELAVTKHTDFDRDFIDLFKNKEDLKKNYDPEIENDFTLNRIISLDNGESLLLGEIFSYRRVSNQNGNTTGELYAYGDMLMVHFGTDGEVLWKDRLPKAQMYYWTRSMIPLLAGGSAGLSLGVPKGVKDYFYDQIIVKDKKVYVTYNDMPENRAGNSYVHELELLKKFRKGVPIVQTIDLERGSRNGEVSRSLVKTKFWLKPGSMYASELNDDVFYFVTYKKKMHIGKTSFK